ncbi:MAG: retron system putative HNH endonuclease [Beijerinckiaceae bacterium]
MRQIRKLAQPNALGEWIAANRSGPNCNYRSVDGELRRVIREALVAEQGGLCAYTGRKIDVETCHIEHLMPQEHCEHLEDVDYRNLVAAVPQANAPRLPYGAQQKDNWPPKNEANTFVSPLSNGCSQRFAFNFKGEIEAKNPMDNAAVSTIERLALNHSILIGFRREAIRRTIQLPGKRPKLLDTNTARRRLHGLQAKDRGSLNLEQFSFALISALEKHIDRLAKLSSKKRRS